MIGHVDESNRALLNILLRKTPADPGIAVTAWIDTAFDGHLVCSRELIAELQLEPFAETEAILADGSKVVLDAFLCYLDWFGEQIPVQIIANAGIFPLLGTGLLEGRVLLVDFVRKTLTLD